MSTLFQSAILAAQQARLESQQFYQDALATETAEGRNIAASVAERILGVTPLPESIQVETTNQDDYPFITGLHFTLETELGPFKFSVIGLTGGGSEENYNDCHCYLATYNSPMCIRSLADLGALLQDVVLPNMGMEELPA